MDLETFHNKLCGTNKAIPKWALLNDTHQRFYSTYVGGKRGFRCKAGEKDFDKFFATLVGALYQTSFPSEGKVTLIMAPAVTDWCIQQMNQILRHLIRGRKKYPRKDVQVLIGAFERLVLGDRPLQLPEVPARWVSYGFSDETRPIWFKGTLLD